MKTIAMYVGEWKPEEIVDLFRCTVNSLLNEGVDILDNTSESLMVIQTPKTYIMFIDDKYKLQGRVFDQLFGAVPDNFAIGRLKDPAAGRFNGGIVEYVTECEYGRRLL